MKTPEIQAEMVALAEQHGIPRLKELAAALFRRQRAMRVPSSSTKMTDEIRDGIRAYKKANPMASQREIAEQFGVNPGRVSEVLSGKRK